MKRHYAVLEREKKIIEELKKNPSSIRGLENSTGYKYYTIRAIIADLMERGILKIYDTIDRERIYTFNSDNVNEHESIPRLVNMVTRQAHKAIMLIALAGEPTEAEVAVNKFPAYLAYLFDMANDASLGRDITTSLNSLRNEMQKSMIMLQNYVSFYEQTLKEPKFWNQKFLQEFTTDPDFNPLEVKKAIRAYIESSGNE